MEIKTLGIIKEIIMFIGFRPFEILIRHSSRFDKMFFSTQHKNAHFRYRISVVWVRDKNKIR